MSHFSLPRWTALAAAVLSGCAAAPPAKDPLQTAQEEHRQFFGNFDLPRKIGTVENVGLQLPAVSPDGNRLLYLRSDQAALSPLTLLGSAEPDDTPADGLLSIWICSAKGTDAGRRVSRGRWSHSPTWSASGAAVAYVASEGATSSIVCLNITTQEEERVGVPNAVNCLPRFGADERTILFCSGPTAAGPFRVFRQTVGEEPIALTPDGQDCVLPACLRDDGTVICAQLESGVCKWVRSRREGLTQLGAQTGNGVRPGLLQTWAGIIDPVSPDCNSLLFYDTVSDRIAVCDLNRGLVRRHRPGSIAACWLGPSTIALATPDGLFCVNVENGVSLPLMSGAWIPVRYVRNDRRLFLLGREGAGSRFSLYVMTFRSPPPAAPAEAH